MGEGPSSDSSFTNFIRDESPRNGDGIENNFWTRNYKCIGVIGITIIALLFISTIVLSIAVSLAKSEQEKERFVSLPCNITTLGSHSYESRSDSGCLWPIETVREALVATKNIPKGHC